MSKKLLIVEDEAMIREMVRDFFELESFEVSEASNGKSAFELMQQQHFDWVISDVRMPGGDGIELAQKIQQMSGSRPKIIFVTGFSDISHAEAGQLGVHKVVAKPFLPDELVEIVNQSLSA